MNHGAYGSMIDCLGGFFGTLGSIPGCCASSLARLCASSSPTDPLTPPTDSRSLLPESVQDGEPGAFVRASRRRRLSLEPRAAVVFPPRPVFLTDSMPLCTQGAVGLVTRFGQFVKAVDPGLVKVRRQSCRRRPLPPAPRVLADACRRRSTLSRRSSASSTSRSRSSRSRCSRCVSRRSPTEQARADPPLVRRPSPRTTFRLPSSPSSSSTSPARTMPPSRSRMSARRSSSALRPPCATSLALARSRASSPTARASQLRLSRSSRA